MRRISAYLVLCGKIQARITRNTDTFPAVFYKGQPNYTLEKIAVISKKTNIESSCKLKLNLNFEASVSVHGKTATL